eukprot:4484478-Heterocapsa_arctica.AAC.1
MGLRDMLSCWTSRRRRVTLDSRWTVFLYLPRLLRPPRSLFLFDFGNIFVYFDFMRVDGFNYDNCS